MTVTTVQMSSLKRDNIKFLDATSKTGAAAAPSRPQGEPGPRTVNIIIQMTEVTFNTGIITFPASLLYNL